MIILRKAENRGQNKRDWLNSYHTFSFADYHDENWVKFGVLRVINEDYIQPKRGFDFHPHRDMEIITYVIRGALKHQDNMGNGSIIGPGEIQRMSAGTGVLHSEHNDSNTEELHLLQIWILPAEKGIVPSYEQKKIVQTRNQLVLLGSPHPTDDAITIHQNIKLYAGYFDQNKNILHSLNQSRGWLQLVKGQILCNEYELYAGDGLAMMEEEQLNIHAIEDSEFLFFEM